MKVVANDSDLAGQSQSIDAYFTTFTSAHDQLCSSGIGTGNQRTIHHPRSRAPACGNSQTPNCPTSITIAWTGTNCGAPPSNATTTRAPTTSTVTPCRNGGTPLAIPGGGCHCPPNYSGPLCGNPICLHGGTPNGATCRCTPQFSGPFCHLQTGARNCFDIYQAQSLHLASIEELIASNGIYQIRLPNSQNLPVYCDMTSGGYTVIQRRVSTDAATVNFNQTWNAYRSFFGNLNGSFYLGNENIYQLTNSMNYSLKISVRDCNDTSAIAPGYIYYSFSIANNASYYALSVSNNSNIPLGAGDSFNLLAFGNPGPYTYTNNGQHFATYDLPTPFLNPPGVDHCSVVMGGGFWYGTACGAGALNSHYTTQCFDNSGYNIRWLTLIRQ